MGILGEYTTYKIGSERFSYNSVNFLDLLIRISDQEERIKKLESQLDKKNGSI